MRNVRSSVLLLSVLLLMAGTVLAQDPDNRDTVRVAKVTTNAGLKVGVPVRIYNDENLGGYSLGFKWNSNDVIVDSISYLGTRLSVDQKKPKKIDNPAHTVLVGMYDPDGIDPLLPGDGLVFTIWFSVASSAPDQFVSLDSTFIPPSGRFVLSLASGVSIGPEFIIGEIKIGNPQPSPIIVLSESAFTFEGTAGGTNPTSQVQHISNGGGQTLNWTATKLAPWLVLMPSNGLAPSDMVVAVNTVGLSGGTYSDTVSVSGVGAINTPQKFAVTLTLAVPPPTIKLTPSSFNFQAQQDGTNPSNQTLNITSTSQGTLHWTATKKSAWLTLSSYSGTAPSNVTLSVDNTGLLAGVYVDSIRISDPTATNDPQYAVVTFEIFSEFPVIVPAPDSIYVVGPATGNPLMRILQIQNNGGGVMNWQLTSIRPWISFTPASGTASQGEPGMVVLNFDGSTLSLGEHLNIITITSTNASNSPVEVPVVYSKQEFPLTLVLSDSIISFSAYECGSYPEVGSKSFIVNPGTAQRPMEWSLDHLASWLTVSPTSGRENTTVTLEVSPLGLSPGVYLDLVHVSCDSAVNPEERVLVTFTVLSTPSVREIGLTEDSLSYIFKYTAVSSVDQDVTIYGIPGGCVNWQATPNVPWLTSIPTSGTTTQDIKIRSNAVGLPPGRHEGKITYSASGSADKEVIVVLWVYMPGDVNADGIVDISDVVYLQEYIFSGGNEPIPFLLVGDTDCSESVDITDVVWLMEYIFSGGTICVF